MGHFVTNFISGKENKAFESQVAENTNHQHEVVYLQTLSCIWKEWRWDVHLNLGVPAACESPVREIVLDLLHECMCVCTRVSRDMRKQNR